MSDKMGDFEIPAGRDYGIFYRLHDLHRLQGVRGGL